MSVNLQTSKDQEKDLQEKIDAIDEKIKRLRQERKDTIKELEFVKRRKKDELFIKLGQAYVEKIKEDPYNSDAAVALGDLPEDLAEILEEHIGKIQAQAGEVNEQREV